MYSQTGENGAELAVSVAHGTLVDVILYTGKHAASGTHGLHPGVGALVPMPYTAARVRKVVQGLPTDPRLETELAEVWPNRKGIATPDAYTDDGRVTLRSGSDGLAAAYPGGHFIVVNRDFWTLKRTTRLAILAHELAHLVNVPGSTLGLLIEQVSAYRSTNESPAFPTDFDKTTFARLARESEFEADDDASLIIGSGLVIQMLEFLARRYPNRQTGDPALATHPTLEARIAAVRGRMYRVGIGSAFESTESPFGTQLRRLGIDPVQSLAQRCLALADVFGRGNDPGGFHTAVVVHGVARILRRLEDLETGEVYADDPIRQPIVIVRDGIAGIQRNLNFSRYLFRGTEPHSTTVALAKTLHERFCKLGDDLAAVDPRSVGDMTETIRSCALDFENFMATSDIMPCVDRSSMTSTLFLQ